MSASDDLRAPALSAGVGILLLCVSGGYGEMTRQEVLRDLGMSVSDSVPQDLVGVNVAAAADMIRTACYSFFLIGVTDIGVAIALYRYLCPSNHTLALIQAVLRLVYTTIELGVTSNLLVALLCLHKNDAACVYTAMMAFDFGWNVIALAIFGLHLIVLGAALGCILSSSTADGRCEGSVTQLYGVDTDRVSSRAAISLLAGLLVVAGVGYIGDSWGMVQYLPTQSPIQLSANGTAVGEILLMLWLFAKYMFISHEAIDDL